MADEIKLKAPTVEQQVVVNISGEDKLEKFADTLDKISKGRGLQKYWKDQQTLINDTIKAYNNFNKSTSQTDATELIKTTNALKAMAGVDISILIPDFDKFTSALSKAEGIAGHLTDAFTEKAFRDAFSSFETLKAYGLDLENFFKHFEFNADVDKLVSELNNANDAVSNLKSKVTQLEDKLEESESGNGIRAVREECENLRWEIERIRDEAAETFSAFLTSNNINAGSYQYEEFFERIREGSLTAQEAIAEFKRDYSYLLEGGASFDTTQLQDFSRRLDDVLKRITDVSEKIDYISSNGVRVSDFGGSGSGNFEELANVVNQIENTNINGSASAIYESLSKILTAIKEISQCDTDNLYHLYSTIRNLAQLNDLKVNKASLDNLADCLERICRIDNSSALTNLSLVNFKNFNDLHISKASLNNLAEYLPQISNIDLGTLTALANLDFDKLNNLHIDKDSMKNLFSFVEGLRNATGLTDFTVENKNVESSADASTGSLKTESELIESIATNAEKAAKAKKEFVEANKELAKATETSATALSKENSELGEMGDKSTMKDTFQGDVKASAKSSTSVIKEEAKAMEQVAENAEKASKSKDKFAKANKKVKENADSSGDAISKEASEFNQIISKLNNYNDKLAKFQVKPNEGNRFPVYQESINDLSNKIERLQALSKKEIDLINENDVKDARELQKEIDGLILKMSKMSAGEKGFDPLSLDKAIQKMTGELEKASGMSKKAKADIQALIKELSTGNPTRTTKEILHDFYKIIQAEQEAGRYGKAFMDIFKDKVIYGAAGQLAGMFGFYDIINYGKQAIDIIVELDTTLIDLKKTTAMTGYEMENFYFEANDVAKEMGVTTKAIIEQSSAWSRLGYNTKTVSTEMAKLSSQFASISPGMDTDTAQAGLVSIMKAWNLDYSDVKSEVMDNINALGNSMALDNQDLVEGMQRSAAALAAVGTSYEDAFSMFSGIQEVLQNAEKSGTALRSVALRIRSFDESTEEYSEDLANITGELIDLTKTAEHSQGISIFKDGSTTEFKSLVDYFGEINGIWDEMTEKQQNDYLIKAFGRTQAQAGSALIQNYSAVVKSIEVMEDSLGSSDREMETIRESLSYKINFLKETWVGTVQEMIDRGDLGIIIDGLTKLSEAIGFVLDKAGLLGTIGLGAGIFTGIKNVGKGKMYPFICFE